jgi:lysophosphatidylglycerol acyltransferase 1
VCGKFFKKTGNFNFKIFHLTIAEISAHTPVIEYGDDLSRAIRERCLVICNHQSTADVPVLCGVLQSKGVASRKVCWVISAIFKWSPFGLVSQVWFFFKVSLKFLYRKY